ncbi:MAG: DUF362 domain-containing protein [Planctomycetaceae bacterium]|nr:DUF362 domain-containing protein [Planctomycetaceae bacterium]
MADANVVSVSRCESYEAERIWAALCRLIDNLGGISSFIRPGRRVLIKPNLIVPKPPQIPAQTHPEVVFAVARMVKETGAHVIIGDSPAWGNTRACLHALGVDERLLRLGAQIVQLDQPVRTNIDGARVGLSRVALEADIIINLPKFKAHQQLGATFALKNMYGCVCGLGGKEKAYWHFLRGHKQEAFCRMIVGVYRRLAPVLTIIDGIIAMEGQGPINGRPRPLGYLVAGADPVACERLCCQLVGFDPNTLPLLQAAAKMGFGLPASEPVQIVGDRFDGPVCPDFLPAVQTPLRFSLPRVFKSITRQLFILMKSALSGRH